MKQKWSLILGVVVLGMILLIIPFSNTDIETVSRDVITNTPKLIPHSDTVERESKTSPASKAELRSRRNIEQRQQIKNRSFPLPPIPPASESSVSRFSNRPSLAAITILATIERTDSTLSLAEIEEFVESGPLLEGRKEILKLVDSYSQNDLNIRSALIRWLYENGYLERKPMMIVNEQHPFPSPFVPSQD